ncbi:hypothetical protein Cantr_09547 [Candida viswanathii]|uniref:Uncharacterized protein n=1 Tax=Candida viswanathii TaxID=5486 RepID=A0A367YF73_9ASCO|nr:hypothetical protein Cantr_09547 [Candida viswanathii]
MPPSIEKNNVVITVTPKVINSSKPQLDGQQGANTHDCPQHGGFGRDSIDFRSTVSTKCRQGTENRSYDIDTTQPNKLTVRRNWEIVTVIPTTLMQSLTQKPKHGTHKPGGAERPNQMELAE